jgi:hypothetical protein
MTGCEPGTRRYTVLGQKSSNENPHPLIRICLDATIARAPVAIL